MSELAGSRVGCGVSRMSELQELRIATSKTATAASEGKYIIYGVCLDSKGGY